MTEKNHEKSQRVYLVSGPRFEQDRQCTYNVTMRRVCATIVAVEKQ